MISFNANPPPELRDQIRRLRSLTDKPFGVNVLLNGPRLPFPVQDVIEVCLAERVSVLSTFWGDPSPYLTPTGRFTFSLHNPAVRSLKLDGGRGEPIVRDFNDGRRTLEFCAQLDPPSPTGIVSGKQFYTIKARDGRILDERQHDVQFHLITKDEIESLIDVSGFKVQKTWGDFDRSEYTADSPQMIYRCTLS